MGEHPLHHRKQVVEIAADLPVRLLVPPSRVLVARGLLQALLLVLLTHGDPEFQEKRPVVDQRALEGADLLQRVLGAVLGYLAVDLRGDGVERPGAREHADPPVNR